MPDNFTSRFSKLQEPGVQQGEFQSGDWIHKMSVEGIILVSATAYADTIWAIYISIGQTASKLMVEITFDIEIKLEIPWDGWYELCYRVLTNPSPDTALEVIPNLIAEPTNQKAQYSLALMTIWWGSYSQLHYQKLAQQRVQYWSAFNPGP